MPVNPRLKAALDYAARGMQVFPAPPGTKESHKSAKFSNGRPWGKTDDPVEIKRDWMRWPNANVCIAMGPDSGYFVLEVDTPQGHDVDGFASLKALEDAHEPLPETRQAISPSGSLHYYFKWPIGATIRNSASSIGPGIDIRGEGGMVLAPPSVKPNVGEYKWYNTHVVVAAPQWLLDLVADTSHVAEKNPSGEAQANVGKVAAALAVIPNLTRDWERWNRVGMAVWAATSGHELGFEAFNNWSKKNAIYNSRTTRDKWDALSTTPITSIGAGSIFYMASEADPEWRDRYDAEIDAQRKPELKVKDTEIMPAVYEAERILLELGVHIYKRSGQLVYPIIEKATAAHDNETKVARLKHIDAVYLRGQLDKLIDFRKYNERLRRWLPCKPPQETAPTLLSIEGEWKFKNILGVISTQTMRPDGTLLLNEGFDDATGLLLLEPIMLPSDMPMHPSRADAEKAMALLEDLIKEFKFIDDNGVAYAVALSSFITPVARGAFDVVPMHMARAPVMSSGKSYLFDIAAMISIGQRMPVMSTGSNEEETEKRLGAALLSGQPLVSIDNVSGELRGDALCQIIERPTVEIRILGKSERVRIETRGVTMFCTGNNTIVVGDLTRRTITTSLDPQVERPELRQFKFDPLKKVAANRGAYIAACLTICRAYILAGSPNKAASLASFEKWSDIVRSALIWLGKADIVTSIEVARGEDPELNQLRDMLTAWSDDLGIGADKGIAVAKVLVRTYETQTSGDLVRPELNAAVQAIRGATAHTVDAKRLGYWLRAKKGRVVDNLRFGSKAATSHSPTLWWVESISGVISEPKTGGEPPSEPEPDIPF